MSKLADLLKKKPSAAAAAAAARDEAAANEATSPSSAAAATPSTASAYMRMLKDYSLLMEYKRLKQQAPTGMYVLPSSDSLRRWYGVIFVRKGHYRGAVFKFVVLIPPAYPDEGPRVHFLSEVFHPLIHPDTGLLDASPQFPVWSPKVHYIVLLLSYVKKIFYKTELWEPGAGRTVGPGGQTGEAMNPRAQNLWMRNKEEYLKLCEQNAAKSASPDKLYNGDNGTSAAQTEDARNSIVFTRPSPAHEEAHRRIVRQELEAGRAGRSYADWFADGVYKLDNGLGSVPANLPPVRFDPPQPVSLSAAASAQASAMLGLKMSPISPLNHSRGDSIDHAGGASATSTDEDDSERAAAVAALNAI